MLQSSVYLMRHRKIIIKKLQAGVTIQANEIIPQLIPPASQRIKRFVSETDQTVVLNGAAIIYLVDIRPQARKQAHGTRLTGGVQLTAGQVIGAKI